MSPSLVACCCLCFFFLFVWHWKNSAQGCVFPPPPSEELKICTPVAKAGQRDGKGSLKKETEPTLCHCCPILCCPVLLCPVSPLLHADCFDIRVCRHFWSCIHYVAMKQTLSPIRRINCTLAHTQIVHVLTVLMRLTLSGRVDSCCWCILLRWALLFLGLWDIWKWICKYVYSVLCC